MKITALLTFISAFALPSAINAYVPSGADTPAFYLVSSSTSGSSNLLPVRMDGSLTGSQPPAIFYFKQGRLVATPSQGGPEFRPLIDSPPMGACATYGALGFVQGTSTNKCARYDSFYIQSNPENAQLGARLTFNWQGAFYACSGARVYYKLAPGDGPQGCDPISLWTVAAS
ncbi:hypothetical protein AX16_009823 [Volvariella volvacea WC 439]|nr:hypothetical protein AX16_009823 [Volvariella volvacea WC 439]